MANTTNFGWETPDDTDLVKDGALAMRTLGNAIDTSLVDLKGGTTGQVLSKNTNTDMDFVWTTPQTGDITEVTAGTGLSGGGTSGAVTLTNTVATTFDAKGDLVVGTGADTFAKLVAGSNGDTLVADSSATTGLRWQGAEAAGKNACINGGMDFWQRGTSSTGQGYIACDRHYLSGATTTWTQETSDVPNGFRYALKAAATGTTQPVILHALETQDVLRFADKTVTLSYYVKTSNSTNALVRLDTSTSTDNSVTGTWTTISSNAKATTTSWSRISHTFTVGSTVKSLRIVIGSDGNLTSGQSIFITGIQLELGSVATSFSKAGGTLAGELAACQRYYWRTLNAGAYSIHGTGFVGSATETYMTIPFPVPMRVAPTSIDFSNIRLLDSALSGFIVTALTQLASSNSSLSAYVNAASTGMTAGRFALLGNNNNTAGYVGFSAEL